MKAINAIKDRIQKRSENTRSDYLRNIDFWKENSPNRNNLGCSNLAHTYASCNGKSPTESLNIKKFVGIITAYNDMLSAHKPYEHYPEEIRLYANEMNATVQVAGGTPAMCDGVTQGQPGMDLSLLSRDIIALSAAIGLSHDMFDGVMNFGICDKIVPGLLIGNLSLFRVGQCQPVFQMKKREGLDKNLQKEKLAEKNF